jgi:tRNA (guanine37-N1)-methyltransferase
MVMQVGPIYRAVKDLESSFKSQESRVILLSAKGDQFNQSKAKEYSELEHIILICGRYEGVDERVHEHIADEVLSIGPYVLSGGEIPAMAVVETTARLIPGVLGNEESLAEESHQEKIEKEYPQYTRPKDFEADGEEWSVPEILLSGDHGAVDEWRQEHAQEG